jgi:hypothetical protein
MKKRGKRAQKAYEAQQQHLIRKKLEVEKLREEGIQYPSYNPPPKRREELTKKEKKALEKLKQKEYLRNTTLDKAFVGWEYKDRYAYRKIEQ